MERAIKNLRGAGLKSHRYGHICCYVLYNFRDTPQDLFERIRDLLAWGIAAYPMRYQPLNGEHALEKDSYVSPNWTIDELNMVQMARRVIGYGGALPPYKGLQEKFMNARNFQQAFELRNTKGVESRPKKKSINHGFELKDFAWDLIHMGRDHQFPTDAVERAIA